MIPARNYQEMLDLADELALDFNGYLDTEGLKRQQALEARFNAARRAFVYQAFKDAPHKATLWPSISSELKILAATGAHSDEAFQRVREALETHIAKQMESHPLMRFAIRWGPPAGVALAAIAYICVKLWRV